MSSGHLPHLIDMSGKKRLRFHWVRSNVGLISPTSADLLALELQDSFCDSTDLKASWERTMMPLPLLMFLAALFQVPKHMLSRMKVRELGKLFQPLENDEYLPNQPAHEEQPLQEQENRMRDHNSTQPHCLFQMIVYNIHSGVNKTPLHMMPGHALYAIDINKSVLTAFNIIVSCTKQLYLLVASWLATP